MRYYEDFEIGAKRLFADSYTFTEEEIVSFARHWDPQPFHIDKTAAAESMFEGLVACSSHIIAASIRLGIDEDPAAAVSALGFNNMKVASPVRPGDVLKCREEVLEKRLSKSHAGCGILNMQCEAFNQRDEIVLQFESAFLIRCRE